MITTGNLKRKPEGQPQKQTVLTTTKVKPKSVEDFRAKIKAQRYALAKRVDARPTRKVGGPMLIAGGMEGRVQNAKRKLLMAKIRARGIVAAKTKPEPVVTPTVTLRLNLPELPTVTFPPEPTYNKFQVGEDEVPAAPPEKKKRAYHRKKDKETE